jgi:hypothetical protein
MLVPANVRHKTPVAKGTLEPTWGEDGAGLEFAFQEVDEDTAVVVQVWDWDRYNDDDPMGEVRLPVSELSKEALWYTLGEMKGIKNPRGEIQLRCSVSGRQMERLSATEVKTLKSELKSLAAVQDLRSDPVTAEETGLSCYEENEMIAATQIAVESSRLKYAAQNRDDRITDEHFRYVQSSHDAHHPNVETDHIMANVNALKFKRALTNRISSGKSGGRGSKSDSVEVAGELAAQLFKLERKVERVSNDNTKTLVALATLQRQMQLLLEASGVIQAPAKPSEGGRAGIDTVDLGEIGL